MSSVVDQILNYKGLLTESSVKEVASRPRFDNSIEHEITRTNPENNEKFDLDVIINFESVLVSKGDRETSISPATSPEWEHTITSVELDLPPIYKESPAAMQALGGPITPEEKVAIQDWFDRNLEYADEKANEDWRDGGSEEDSRADFEYDKIKDRRMGF